MNKKVLYISSLNPSKGPGAIAMDHYKALKSGGYEVDFLTLLPVANHPEIKFAMKKKYSKYSLHQFSYKVLKLLTKKKYYKDRGFFYRKENEPPVPFEKIKRVISKDYNMVVIFFWQGLLSYETVIDIYQYIGSKPKVVFMCADYSPMTGGCHFFGSCEEYSSECGRCPMINSKNKSDFTHWNNIFRQKVIKEIKPVILVNTYMRRFFERSSVVAAGATLKSFSLTMDLEQFRPISSSRILDKYNLKKDDKFIIFFGCQNLDDARKGMDYLVESLNKFYSKITNEEAANVLILSIGKNSNYISEKIKFQRKHLGYVPFEDLPLLYSFADIFLSASVNDAGPSMVNQSIACGTPVVAFEIGSALDVIKDKGTGYTVPLKNTEAFADAIWKIYKLSSLERKNLSIRCRTVAVQHQSYEALVSTIDECFS